MRWLFLILSAFLMLVSCDERQVRQLDMRRELVVLVRSGSLTYLADDSGNISGFDYELAQAFADHLGLKARFIVVQNDAEILRRLRDGDAHLAASWLVPVDEDSIRHSLPYAFDKDVLVIHEASLPIESVDQLHNRTIQVIAGSRQEKILRSIQEKVPSMVIKTSPAASQIDLMEKVAQRQVDAVLISSAVYDIGKNAYPELINTLAIGEEQPVVWLFGPGAPPDLPDKANAFLKKFEENSGIQRLKDKYFGHIKRLTQNDVIRFIEAISTVLPRYKGLFQEAQIVSGIDWRMLAALAYQESKWDPLATSPTGVRGMMMLTEDTADHLRVSNRLDAEQSIKAGAKYLAYLRDLLPPTIDEPDRLWLALAAYNLGMGHLNAARHIAKTLNVDPDSWYEMKKVLPLLAKPEYYRRLKSGRGRGGEAVILTENVRGYADILYRRESLFNPLHAVDAKGEMLLNAP